jgi:hypothetical protein
MDFCTPDSFITKYIRITCSDSEIDVRELIRSLARMDNRRAGLTAERGAKSAQTHQT